MKVRSALIQGALKRLVAEGEVGMTVTGDCMAPLIPSGAVVFVSRKSCYLPGDVIVFEDDQGRLFAHRLLGYYWRRKQVLALTQADNGLRPDKSMPTARIIGRVTGGRCASAVSDVPFGDRVRALGKFARFVLDRLRSR